MHVKESGLSGLGEESDVTGQQRAAELLHLT